MVFRFVNRWQDSLASLFPNRDDKLALLELRDRDLETHLSNLDVLDASFTAQFAALGVWADYTPTLTASTVNPNLGATGTAVGRKVRVGDLVVALGAFTFGGAGVAAGTGDYRFGLPHESTSSVSSSFMPGFCRVFDSSAGLFGHFTDLLVSPSVSYASARYQSAWPTSATESRVGAAVPWVWAAGDIMQFGVVYEAAP